MARGKTAPLSSSDLKAFRHSVSILKKKGLISQTDARRAQPYWIRGGNRLDKLVAKFDDVISGKATAVAVSDKQVRQYRKAGFETTKDRVIIPHSAGERAKVLSKGQIKVQKIKKSETGIRSITLPIPFRNLKQWLKDAKEQAGALDSLKGGRKVWAYKFYGHNSYATYEDLELLFEELAIGTASGLNLNDKAQQSSYKQGNEIYQNFALFAVPTKTDWVRRDLSKRGKISNESRRKYRRRIKGSVMGERAMDKNAEDQQKFRDKLKGAKLDKYKKKARTRAKKARAKRKK
jgi:hypothetical protein